MVRVVNDDATPLPQLHPRCALFLDFDGTLAPIALRPQDVEVGPWLVPALRMLHVGLSGALAIISGRPLSELDAFLAPLRLPAAGVHGVERRDAQGRTRVQAGAPPADVLYTAERVVARYPELRLERKPSALALHYREAPHLGDVCQQTLLAAVRPHQEDWAVLLGKCVVEVKPKRATKAHAVIEFMESEEFVGRVPIFIGDDATDEDGFTAVQAAGGAGIKVGPGPSGALHRLAGTDEVCAWLQSALEQWPQVASAQSAA